VKVACNIDVIDRDEAGFADLEFATNGFADFALQ
jgi:hypothetical protein